MSYLRRIAGFLVQQLTLYSEKKILDTELKYNINKNSCVRTWNLKWKKNY